QGEQVAEFFYQPTACSQPYRMVVVRKDIAVSRGERLLYEDMRYFFYITNLVLLPAAEVVWLAHHRCDPENLLAPLHGGVHALQAPVNTLAANGAYMVMTALAWNLKAWWALLLPVQPGRWREEHWLDKQWVLRLEFKTFVQAFVRLPCQLLRTGRK